MHLFTLSLVLLNHDCRTVIMRLDSQSKSTPYESASHRSSPKGGATVSVRISNKPAILKELGMTGAIDSLRQFLQARWNADAGLLNLEVCSGISLLGYAVALTSNSDRTWQAIPFSKAVTFLHPGRKGRPEILHRQCGNSPARSAQGCVHSLGRKLHVLRQWFFNKLAAITISSQQWSLHPHRSGTRRLDTLPPKDSKPLFAE